ncbi:helix-turn-helix domain-containing protein [Desulfoscipio gibsoniae]
MKSERIKLLREEKNLRQEDLGKILGVGKTTISQYENGVRKPDSDMLQKIANYFCVSVDYILGRTDVRESPEKIVELSLQDDLELLEFWSELKKRKDLQLLFKQVKPMTPEGVKKVIRIIKALEEEHQDKEN